jgi:hypothetical protein
LVSGDRLYCICLFSLSHVAAKSCPIARPPKVVKLTMPEPTPGEPGDIDAEMDELADNDYIPVSNQFFFIFLLSHCLHKTEPSSSTAKAPKSRKRKGASLPEPVASKCHARSSQGQPQDQEACYN